MIYTIYVLYILDISNSFCFKINCVYLHNNCNDSQKKRNPLLRFRPGCLDDKLKFLLFNRMLAVKVSVGHMWSEEKNAGRTSTAQKSKETKNRRNNKKFKFAEKVFNASGFILKASWTRIFTNTGTESTQAYLRPNWLRPPQIVITAALSRATHQSLVTFPNSTRAAWIFHLAEDIHRKPKLSSPAGS